MQPGASNSQQETQLDDQTDQTRLGFMKPIAVHEAKAKLSRLIEESMAGEEIVIVRAERRCGLLTSVRQDQRPRSLGGWGPVWIPDDFDAPTNDIAEVFERAGAGPLHDE